MTSPRPVLEIQDLSVSLGGRPVLQNVDLQVRPGEALALLGPSGSGKTTLLRCINGTLAADAGEIRLQGKSLRQLSPKALRRLRSEVGFIHQDLGLVPNLRVLPNVLTGQLGRQGFWPGLTRVLWPAKNEVERVFRLLDRVGIGDTLYQRVDTLSGGQQQRVAVVRALFQEPEILLADEPVASLDPARAWGVVNLLRGLAREHGLCLIVSLHDLELARDFFPRIVGLRGGKVAYDGPTRYLSELDFKRLYRLEADEPS